MFKCFREERGRERMKGEGARGDTGGKKAKTEREKKKYFF